MEQSIWRTWKPYVALVVLAVGATWWYTDQSSFAKLKDGAYACTAVYVNGSGKYEVLVDQRGTPYPPIAAAVRGGRLANMSGDTPLNAAQLTSLTVRKRGNSHFHATDDPAMHSYNAIACDHTSG